MAWGQGAGAGTQWGWVRALTGLITCQKWIGSQTPNFASLLECISGPSVGWLCTLLTAPIVVQEQSFIDNPLQCLFVPCKGEKVVVDHSEATISLSQLFNIQYEYSLVY